MEYPLVDIETGTQIGQQLGDSAGRAPARVAKIGFLIGMEAIGIYLTENGDTFADNLAPNQAIGPNFRAGTQQPRRRVQVTTPAEIRRAESPGFGPIWRSE